MSRRRAYWWTRRPGAKVWHLLRLDGGTVCGLARRGDDEVCTGTELHAGALCARCKRTKDADDHRLEGEPIRLAGEPVRVVTHARGFPAFGPPTLCGERGPLVEVCGEITCPACVEILGDGPALMRRLKAIEAAQTKGARA